MSRFYFNSFTLKDYILLLFPILVSAVFMYTTNNIIQSIVFNNYLYYAINNAYLVQSFTKINEMNRLGHLLIPRLGNKTFYLNTIISSCVIAIVFFIFQYVFMVLVYGGIPVGYEKYVLLFTVFYVLVFVIMQCIVCLQVGKKMNIIYLLLPIFLNLLFRYYFVEVYFAL